jgi:hypothetical protein
MATTLSAQRVVVGDPAVVVLLMTGPSAADFLPHTVLTAVDPGEISGVLEVGTDQKRDIRVVTTAPRRTPTAYISQFEVMIDGMPPAVGALRVMSAGPGESQVEFSMRSEEDIPDEFQAMFTTVVGGFFDNLERAARAQSAA